METREREHCNDGTQRRGSDPTISCISTRRPSQQKEIIRRNSSISHRQNRDLHLQHSWIMVLAPRSRPSQRRGNTKQQQRQFQERNLPSFCDPSHHPRTQLWQPVSPFEECPLLFLAVASNGKSLEKVRRSEHCRSRSAGAVDLLRSPSIAGPPEGIQQTCNQQTRNTVAANDPDTHSRRRVPSHSDAPPLNSPQTHLVATGRSRLRDPSPIVATPTRSGVGVPRSTTAAHTPSRTMPSRKMLAHTSSTQTVNRMTTTTKWMLGDAHQVPLEIHIPGTTARSRTVERGGGENPTTRDSAVDEKGGDEFSEISMEEEILVTKGATSKENSDKTSSTYHSSSSRSEDPVMDHPMFHEAMDLADFYPRLSKFHSSLGTTTHDSTWGITTAMLEGADDASWPSDEERTPDKYAKTKKPPRCLGPSPTTTSSTANNSIRSDREDSVRDAAPTTWEQVSCSAGFEFCSAGPVRPSFFHPVFPGRKIPWPTACRDNHDDDDSSEDENDWKWQPTPSKRASKSKKAAKVGTFSKESSSQTDTTEASSTVEKSGKSRV